MSGRIWRRLTNFGAPTEGTAKNRPAPGVSARLPRGHRVAGRHAKALEIGAANAEEGAGSKPFRWKRLDDQRRAFPDTRRGKSINLSKARG